MYSAPFILPWARPCGVNSAAGMHRCAAHCGDEEDECTFSHMRQMLKKIGRCEISVYNDLLTNLGEPFNGSSAPEHYSQPLLRSN